jgi:ABC-2 type transport system permease protein
VNKPGTLVWFARHELRLTWRDGISMMTAGRPGRGWKLAVGLTTFILCMHAVAFYALRRASALAIEHDLPTLIATTCTILLSAAAMLSQAMESVTRIFYTRSDLELILSSPARTERLFAIRMATIILSVGVMSLFLLGPFIDMLAWLRGPRWLGGYGVVFAVSLTMTAVAIVLTVALFRTIGPKRTRLAAQIAAALVGGAFIVGLQLAAMFSTGTMSRFVFLRSRIVEEHVPNMDSAFWWPARSALGDLPALGAVFIASLALFLLVAAIYAPRFAGYTIEASSISQRRDHRKAIHLPFRVRNASAALRRKEMLLLLRDPWLMSQSLMQLLYLIPPAFLLAKSFALSGRVAVILVPILIMAAGQLAGGLAWLTISGEEAKDLVQTAPVLPSRVLHAKIEAVMECILVVFCPFVICLALFSPAQAIIAAFGIAASAVSSAMIQLWFRSQAKRSHFRRRHTSSRIATFAEAFSSIVWAAAGAVAASGSWMSVIVAVAAMGILALVRLFSPARENDMKSSKKSPGRLPKEAKAGEN